VTTWNNICSTSLIHKPYFILYYLLHKGYLIHEDYEASVSVLFSLVGRQQTESSVLLLYLLIYFLVTLVEVQVTEHTWVGYV